MLNSTKVAILRQIKKYMAENGHNMESIRHNNPFAPHCSSRWISDLVYSVKNKTNASFRTSTCVAVMNFLKMTHEMKDGVLVVCENSN